jgi:AraC-like DNA-binding protein
MIFQDFSPLPSLSNYIKSYRVRHFKFSQNFEHAVKPYPARPEQCIAFFVRGSIQMEDAVTRQEINVPLEYLSGQYTNRLNKKIVGSEMLMILVVFKPGAIYQLTGMPSIALFNTGIALEEVFSSETKQLREQLTNSSGYSEMITYLDAFFLERFKIRKTVLHEPFQQMVNQMGLMGSLDKVEKMASDACLSMRQLERVFYQCCGVSPSKMAQIVRFDTAYRLRLKHPEYPWLRIAMESGFYDYQHLVKSFKEFAGSNPNELFTAESNSPERVLGLVRRSN